MLEAVCGRSFGSGPPWRLRERPRPVGDVQTPSGLAEGEEASGMVGGLYVWAVTVPVAFAARAMLPRHRPGGRTSNQIHLRTTPRACSGCYGCAMSLSGFASTPITGQHPPVEAHVCLLDVSTIRHISAAEAPRRTV